MKLQDEKLELVRMILDADDRLLLQEVKAVFKSREKDWWEELPEYVKEGIKKSKAQADRGKVIPFNEVKGKVNSLLAK